MFNRFFDWPIDESGFLNLIAPVAGSDNFLMSALRSAYVYIFDFTALNAFATVSTWNMVCN